MIGKKEHQYCEEVKNDHQKQTSLLITNKSVIAKKQTSMLKSHMSVIS